VTSSLGHADGPYACDIPVLQDTTGVRPTCVTTASKNESGDRFQIGLFMPRASLRHMKTAFSWQRFPEARIWNTLSGPGCMDLTIVAD